MIRAILKAGIRVRTWLQIRRLVRDASRKRRLELPRFDEEQERRDRHLLHAILTYKPDETELN